MLLHVFIFHNPVTFYFFIDLNITEWKSFYSLTLSLDRIWHRSITSTRDNQLSKILVMKITGNFYFICHFQWGFFCNFLSKDKKTLMIYQYKWKWLNWNDKKIFKNLSWKLSDCLFFNKILYIFSLNLWKQAVYWIFLMWLQYTYNDFAVLFRFHR